MSTKVGLDDMETTRAEKFLAFVLAVFLLIGGLWAYFQPLDRPVDQARFDAPAGTATDRAATERDERARAQLRRARRAERGARTRLELAREDYRTALDAGRSAPALERAYRERQAQLREAQRRVSAARARVRATAPPARAASERIGAAAREAERAADDARRSSERTTFALRLAFALASLAGAFLLFGRQRRSHSRYLPIGMAAVGAATALALVMATDYTTDYVDPTEAGPLVLSLAGVALTLGAFAALQRYLAQRVPQRRVRRGECPFCGFPVRGGRHCEGCGREVVAPCATCSDPRRVGTPFCTACGSA
jgi:hypothetical protein